MSRIGCPIGGIRWPAQISDRNTFIVDYLNSPSGIDANRVFTLFGNRAPSLWDNYTISGPGIDTQAILNAELQAAVGCLDFWSYNWYPPPSCFAGDPQHMPSQSKIMLPFEAHRSSPYATNVKAMLMLSGWYSYGNSLPLVGDWSRVAAYNAHLIACMNEPCYFRLNGRPVIGMFGYAGLTAGDQTIFNTQLDAVIAAVGQIYIIAQDFSQSTALSLLSRGCNYRTTYGPNPGPGSVVNNTQYPWEKMRAADVANSQWPGGGIQYFASLTPFNDQRPRNLNTWWIDQPTMPEWQTHISAAFNLQVSGFGTHGPDVIVCYSWDEIDEGGPGMSPTTQEGRRYIDAIKWAKNGQWPDTYIYPLDAAQLNFTKTGSWAKSAQTVGLFNNDELISSTINDTVDVSHQRIYHFGLIAVTGPDRGIVALSTDGGSETNIDLYSSVPTQQTLVWTSPRLDGGTHTMRARVTGNKNINSSSFQIGYDACTFCYKP